LIIPEDIYDLDTITLKDNIAKIILLLPEFKVRKNPSEEVED